MRSGPAGTNPRRMSLTIPMDDQPPTTGETIDFPQQAVFLPLDEKRQVLAILVVIEKGEDGEVTLSRPYLDDIETAGIALAGRNWSLDG